MAILVKDRVKETTTTTGTGTVTLLGASAGFQSFSAIGNGNVTYYAIVGQSTSEWEVGIGTYTSSGTTLSRDTILASSNSGSAVNFSAGTKDVFVTYPASAGQLPYTFNNQTSAYTVVASDLGKVINCTTGTFTVSLTSAATLGSGFNCWVWNSGAGTITIDPASSETIDGSATVSLTANQTTQIVSNGSNWYTIGKAVTIPTALLGITNSASPYTTALGYQAGASVTGDNNTLVGYQAGTAITAGIQNVAIGNNTLDANISGDYGTAIGSNALGSATGNFDGTYYTISSVAIGNNALSNQTTGKNNVAIGDSAAVSVQTAENSTFVGRNAGQNNRGSQNVFLGASSGGFLGSNTGSNNIVIGYTASQTSGSVSNEITLGNASITSFRIPGISLTWTSSGLPVANGGTGQTTYTDGQLLIGNTAGGLTKSTLTAGSNITITNGNGAITIAAAGGGGGAATILESKQTISSNYTLTAGYNGISVGPVTISSGVSVTIPSGAKWLVVNSSPGATPVSGGGGIMPAMIWG